MQDQINEYKISPENELIFQERIRKAEEIEKNILETRQLFASYIQNGTQMCKDAIKLTVNFEKLIGEDNSLASIKTIIAKFTTVMSEHYKFVQNNIIDPLDKFSSTDIKKTENDGKTALHDNQTFLKLLNSYASTPIKKRNQNSSEFQESELKLIAQNWKAVKSNFSFARSLGLSERKRVVDVTSYYIEFSGNLGHLFSQCADIYDKLHDNFDILKNALPSSANELKIYDDQTSNLENTLQKIFNIYFNSFNTATVYKPSDDLFNEGFLWLREQKSKKWKKRYCILKDGVLSAYKFKDGQHPVSTFKLLTSTVKPFDDPERPSCFTIISTEFKQMIFQALTGYEREKWINIIQNNISWLLNSGGKTDDSSQSSNNPIRSQTLIMRISSIPENSFCADCHAKSPSWVCINWGTVICIHCSGVHRSLTTSVSKVRSTTLDRIDDITVELFKIIGNMNANSILEEMLEPTFQHQRSNSSNQQQQNAIQYNQQQPQYNQQQPQYNRQQSQFNQQQFQYNQQQSQYNQQQNKRTVQFNQQQQQFNRQVQFNQQLRPTGVQNAAGNLGGNQNPQFVARTSPVLINRPSSQYGISPVYNQSEQRCCKITPESPKEMREAFITKKYKNIAFVKKTLVNVDAAIKSKDILTVYRSICTGQIHNVPHALHLAASCGDPLLVRLIALNSRDPNAAINGWTPLSYASYYDQIKAAQVLLMSGCSPSMADPSTHPYRIAVLKHNEEMAALFFPYWDKSQVTGQLEQPPQKFI